MIAQSFPLSVTGTSEIGGGSRDLADGLVMPNDTCRPDQGKTLVAGLGVAPDAPAVPGGPPGTCRESFARWRRNGSLNASYANARTAIKPFLADVVTTFADPIGNEMTTGFAARLETHLASSGLSPRAASSRRYVLKKVHGSIANDRGKATSCTSGATFAGTLNPLLSERKLANPPKILQVCVPESEPTILAALLETYLSGVAKPSKIPHASAPESEPTILATLLETYLSGVAKPSKIPHASAPESEPTILATLLETSLSGVAHG